MTLNKEGVTESPSGGMMGPGGGGIRGERPTGFQGQSTDQKTDT